VLWGWGGEPLSADETAGVERVRAGLDGELGDRLSALVTEDEVAALVERCDRLVRAGRFPAPGGDMPAVPWPLF
jgi:hypothetical protein